MSLLFRVIPAMIKQVLKHIDKALSRIRLPFRGVINTVNSSAGIQLVQLSGVMGETLQAVEIFQHLGFTSVPLAGTDCIVIPIGGKTAQSVVVGTENPNFRLKGLEGGETAIYSPASGASIILHADGSVAIHATGSISYDGPSFIITNGDLVVQGHSFIGHKHSGVQPGAGESGTLI